jgi:hypothetical protein
VVGAASAGNRRASHDAAMIQLQSDRASFTSSAKAVIEGPEREQRKQRSLNIR